MDCTNPDLFWELHGDEYLLQKDVNFDLSDCEWNSITLNEANISNMMEEKTPVKACGDVPYHFDDCDFMIKNLQESEPISLPSKRRRVLDFQNNDDIFPSNLESKELIDSNEQYACPEDFMIKKLQDSEPISPPSKRRRVLDIQNDEDIFFSNLESKERLDSIDAFLSDISQWETSLPDSLSPASFDDLSQSEVWFAECLDVTSMDIINSTDGNGYISPDTLTGKSDVSSSALAHNMSQQTVRSSQNVIFKGTKTYMRPPPKRSSTIVYPFEIIKPCSLRGDVTLKDINHLIKNPKAKEKPSISPFSGKLVVGKTRIPTQGGKGSITIMRTQG